MVDLSTNYATLQLKSPLVASSSPLCESVDNVRTMEDAGAAAVMLYSLFEEQVTLESEQLDYYLTQGTESFAEALTYFPDLKAFKLGPDEYLEHIRRVKQAVDIPVAGSLNGVSEGGWTQYAKAIEQSGADALELNIYYVPTNPEVTSQRVEKMYADLVRDVKASVGIPVAVKIGPYFSSLPSVARSLDQAGADALVLFNRFYQPDIDVEDLSVVPDVVLSTSDELRLRLRWVAILFGQIRADLAVTGGVHTAVDVVKAMMTGARAAMMTSALLQNGIGHLATLTDALVDWMEQHEYESVRQMQGSMSQQSVAEPAAFERANYIKVLQSHRPNTPR